MTIINSAAEFVALRTSELPEEQWKAAHEPASDETWLEVINTYPDMRRWVVRNKTIPLSILEILSVSDDRNVRSEVATKRKLSPTLFSRLAADPDASVRERIAYNSKVPTSILEQLTSDENEEVATVARKRLELRLHKISPNGDPET